MDDELKIGKRKQCFNQRHCMIRFPDVLFLNWTERMVEGVHFNAFSCIKRMHKQFEIKIRKKPENNQINIRLHYEYNEEYMVNW